MNMMQRQSRRGSKWRRLAACRTWPALDWIEAQPGSVEAAACKCVCRCCPVRLTCAVSALADHELWGVWGGLDAAERAVLAGTDIDGKAAA